MGSAPQFIEAGISANVQALAAGRDREVIILFEIAPSKALDRIAQQRLAGPHVGLILDVSHSMLNVVSGSYQCTGKVATKPDNQTVELVEGAQTKLVGLIAAAKKIISALTSRDMVSISTFSGTVQSAAVAVAGNEHGRLHQAVDTANTALHSTTAMGDALASMYEVLQRDSSEKPKTAILFTDGQPYPVEQEGMAREWADKYGKAGITLHVLGFGDDLRLHYVEELTSRGRGVMFHVRELQSLETQLQQTVEHAQEVGVTNARLALTLPPFVVPADVHRGRPQNQFMGKLDAMAQRHEIPIGSLRAADFQSIFVRCLIQGSRLREGMPLRALNAEIIYDVPNKGLKGLKHPLVLDIPVEARERPHSRVDNSYAMIHLKQEEDKFQRLCSDGKFEEARSVAAGLISGYRRVGTKEAEACAADFQKVVTRLGNRQVSIQDIQALLNEISVSSSTASGQRITSETRSGTPVYQGRIGG